MTTKTILIIAILAYSVIVSQSFMYMLTLKQVQLNLDAQSYTELRKLIDTGMNSNFKYVMYIALFSNFTLVFCTIKNPSNILFITAVIAFVALIADVLLALKGSIPINEVINSWSNNNYPTNWAEYRAKWFSIFQYRQVANIIGFIGLLIGAVCGSK